MEKRSTMAFEILAEELRGGGALSDDGRDALDVLSFLYGGEEEAKRVVLASV